MVTAAAPRERSTAARTRRGAAGRGQQTPHFVPLHRRARRRRRRRPAVRLRSRAKEGAEYVVIHLGYGWNISSRFGEFGFFLFTLRIFLHDNLLICTRPRHAYRALILTDASVLRPEGFRLNQATLWVGFA